MNRDADIRCDIVLVGGGHAHVHVLKAFGMRPEKGVRVTLITRDLETPYSGMLPGVIAGHYAPEAAHIDLMRLATAASARLIHAEAVGLDRVARRVMLAGRAPVAYDLVSIDVGITPALEPIEGAAEHGIVVKPIGSFMTKFDALRACCRRPDGPRRIAVIGGGAGGVELLLSMRARLLADAREAGLATEDFSFALITAGALLKGHNERVRAAFRRIFVARGIALYEHRPVRAIGPGAIDAESGAPIAADAVIVTTDAAAPAWFRGTGIALDPSGFLAVGPTLQALNDPAIFAAGDAAALVETPREKAGVFAVRAGPPLAENLRRRALDRPLRPWRPQRAHLALVSTGERYAVASRAGIKLEGAWLWRLKDWIDRRWMRKYQDVAGLLAGMSKQPLAQSAQDRELELMRCGGCAAKIGPGPLARGLARLDPKPANGLVIGLETPDDAAVMVPPPGHLVQTVDFFRAFVSDPYVFGEIAANHALNDIFAMGGMPHYALAVAVVPPGPAAKVEEMLFQLLAGARACLDREAVALVGGHSSEGGELALGFSVTGAVDPDRVLRKRGLKLGDRLILTRKLGTGILFAGAMRAQARAPAIAAAVVQMRRSNRDAADILAAAGATALTDVSGFGLVGHLGEMLAASGAEAILDLGTIPLLDGAHALARADIASTLLPENLALAPILRTDLDDATRALLFDPQTAGGLLAGVPAAHAAACVERLRAAGHIDAAVIGHVTKIGLAPASVGIVATGALPAIAD
ncbi:MAG: selenide, water dikinase SelD [Alphaproteobacteria bacterium]